MPARGGCAGRQKRRPRKILNYPCSLWGRKRPKNPKAGRIRRPEESGGRKRPNQAYQMGTRPGCRPGPWPKPDQTRRDSTTVFSVMGSERSPAFLPILLLLSGDIETNPGPWPCPTCQRPYTRRLGSILCRTCGDWTHRTQRCAGLRQGQEVPPWWVCSSCHPNHGQAAQPPPKLTSSQTWGGPGGQRPPSITTKQATGTTPPAKQ